MCIVFHVGGRDSSGSIWGSIWWVDGVETCKVGYLSKEICAEADYLDNKYIMVDDVFTKNDEDVDRCRKFYQCYGDKVAIWRSRCHVAAQCVSIKLITPKIRCCVVT